jgi:hypothetical protein
VAKVPPPKKTGKGAPQQPAKTVGNLDKPEPTVLTPMNFKVPEVFHRSFKTYAAQHGKSMVEVLYEAFTALKGQHERTK